MAIQINDTKPLIEYIKSAKDLAMRSEEILDIFIKICRQIEDLHNKGFVHTNIHPREIYVSESKGPIIVINDGALLKIKSMGTCAFINEPYTSNEAYLCDIKVKQTIDIYSLGILLYYMMTGNNLQSAIDRMVEEDKSDKDLNAYIENVELRKVIKRAISLNEKKRYKTVGALIKAVSEI